MISLYDKEEFTEKDIQSLIDNEIEESIHLDFKSAGSLDKSDGKKKELSKDIAAFANSDGGIIIYGIEEKGHKADSLSFVNGNEFTKEWIEQIINTTIQRHIPDLRIYPVRFDSNLEKTIYVVKIPKSLEAPHMSKDKRFYKRYNFESVTMEEYEIRQLYGRKSKSSLLIGNYGISVLTKKHNDYDEDFFKFQIEVSIINNGDIPESEYKLNLYFNNFSRHTSIGWDNISGAYDSTRYDNNRVKISTSKCPTIYPTEKVDAIRVVVSIEKDFIIDTLDNLDFELLLFYANGEDELKGDFKELLNKLRNNDIQHMV
jgi:hypothetical protein